MEELTDLDERRERPCGHEQQPHFDILAQDISSDLVVDFWIKVNLMIRDNVRQGYSLEKAVVLTRQFYFLPMHGTLLGDEKLNSASEIAAQMRKQANRKLAD